jgi:hypothetical protein
VQTGYSTLLGQFVVTFQSDLNEDKGSCRRALSHDLDTTAQTTNDLSACLDSAARIKVHQKIRLVIIVAHIIGLLI